MSNNILNLALVDGNEAQVINFDGYRQIKYISRKADSMGRVLADVKIEYGIVLTIDTVNKLYKSLTK